MSIVKMPLLNGGVTLVDHDVAEKLENLKLYRLSNGYVRVSGCRNIIDLHRMIMNPPEGMVVDHIDGNKLDNSRVNLRVCTHSQNNLNRRFRSIAISGYRLVYKNHNRFRVHICLNKREINCGNYLSRHVAAVFADQILVQTVGPFVMRNFQEKVSISCLADFIESTSGRIFRVVFSRRSDGLQREMVCRTGVNSRHSGGSIPFNPISMNLFSVYDVQKCAYRFIPLDSVICIRFAKKNYRVVA